MRLPIGAVPLIPLAALAARAEGPVVDPGPVRIQYEQRTSIEPGAAGGQGKHRMLGARIFADWTVKSADEKRIVLAAKVREARLECSRSGDATSEADMDGGEGCSVTASSGELEAIVTRAGASLAGDLVSFLKSAQIRQPGNPRATSVPGYALEPFRVAITTAAFEAFAHLLTPARVVTSDGRRLEIQDLQGRHAGAFEISFPPPERWEAGDLGWASGSSRFTPPGGKAVDLPDRPVRLTWTHRGRRRDEWIARLGHPGSNPIPMTYDTRRRVTVEARFSARWLGEESPGPEAVLERVQLAAGQRFLVDLSTNEELRTSARAMASRSWHEATGILALAVTGATAPAGGVRFEGLFVSGMLREASVAGVSAARIFDPASLETVPSLAGVTIGAETGKDGLAVTVDDASWRSALGATPRDAGRAGALHAALSRAVTASLQAALADPAPGSPPVWSATILDAEGNAVGEATLASDGKAPQRSNEYRLDGRRLERKTFPLAAACRGPVAPVAPRSDGSAPVLSRVIDSLLPMPAEASLQASLEARDPKAPASALISVTAWLQTQIKARQIGGPRCHPAPAAPARAAPAAPPPLPARPPDTSPRASLGPARTFLKGVKSQRGTNIHAALAKAFELPEVGAVCLLSDGHPTVGPGPDEIERDVFRWNYLRGARIVAASFTGDIADPENLCLRLARQWFGWVRALNAGAVAAPAPGLDAPPAPVDSDY
jgi:hypothetical protein